MKKAKLSRSILRLYLTIATCLFTHLAMAQPAGTTDFYGSIKHYDLATLWHAGSLRLLSLKESEPFPEPYGTLGKNYQRFYIHYTSVTKHPANPYLYQVKGKTRIGNNVRPFTGTIMVKQVGIYKDGSANAPDTYKGYKRGQLICRVTIKEIASAPESGTINGDLTTNFCINAQNQVFYDTLDFGIDGYGNNLFTGWRGVYGSKVLEKLQYGDFNHPDPQFSEVDGITVPSRFVKYGWQSFVEAQQWQGKPGSQAAVAEEKRQWWK